jgi:hypothetical protein
LCAADHAYPDPPGPARVHVAFTLNLRTPYGRYLPADVSLGGIESAFR